MELWLQILVPFCLVIIMVIMGLDLTPPDFLRVLATPWPTSPIHSWVFQQTMRWHWLR